MRVAVSDLDRLAAHYGTDKGPGHHHYTAAYHGIFAPHRDYVRSVLEIGVLKEWGAASVKMWRDYFPHATVHGIDVDDCTEFAGERLCIYHGDATNIGVLDAVCAAGAPFDIVIDDGSHVPHEFLATFAVLWPQTRLFYVIEDVFPEYLVQTEEAVRQVAGPSYVLLRSDNSTSTSVIVMVQS